MKVILITGASTGLGLAVARRLIDFTEHHLILTARARSLERFREAGIVEGKRVWIRPLDVTDAEQRREVVEEASWSLGPIDVLINNAGVAYRSVVEHVREEERLHQMSVNFRSPMELIRQVLPGMRAKRSGRIINISSVGGMMAMPTMAVYSASKFALEGACEALYYEVRPWNIFVTLVEPGFISSDAFEKVSYTELSEISSAQDWDPYHNHYYYMESFIEKMMKKAMASPESVGRTVVKLVDARRPPLRVTATFDARIFDIMRRLLPRRFYHWLLYRNLPMVRDWSKVPENH